MRGWLALAAVSIFLIAAATSCRGQPRVFIATPGGGEAVFQVEVADTPAKRELGLQYRTELAADRGMIFLFPAPSVLSFWMKNTPIPLDMIFIGSDRKIVGIVEQTVPFSLDSRSVPAASQFVLEINGGLAARLGIKPGSAVRFEGIALQGVKE
jgi:uncharacterized membrane protein (UPF0127 family)